MPASLTTDGLEIPRSDEIRDGILDELEEATGEPIDRDRLDDRVDGVYASILGDRLDDLYQLVQAVADSRSVNNATGRQLDDLSEIVGVPRRPATYSAVTVTIAGTVGTAIPQGKLVEGGGTDGKARWAISEDVTIPALGTVAVVAVAVVPGAVVAQPGDVVKIVNGVSGWASVTNAAAATVGQDRESDADLRVRRLLFLSRAGAGTTDSIRSAVLALAFVEGVVVLSNNLITPAVVQGLAMTAASLAIYVHPSTLTVDQQEELAEAIWSKAPAGIERMGSVNATVTDAAGGVQVVTWEWATPVPLTIVCTTTLAPGYVLADVEEPITDAVVEFFEALVVGEVVRVLALSSAVYAMVPGVVGLSWTFDDGAGPAAGDYSPAIIEIATTTAGLVTVA